MNSILKRIRKILRKSGVDIIPYPDRIMRKRIELIKKYNIDLLLDVGASSGGYGQLMRSIGYKGEIISFEPLIESFSILEKTIRNDSKWKALNYALGDFDGETKINISGNFDSSSILEMNKTHVINSPHSKIISVKEINVHRLDTIIKTYVSRNSNILLKIDTQGFEKQVLDGATESLKVIKGIQIEMSFEELYKGQILFEELKRYLEQQGYTLCMLEPGFCSPITGKLLQADGIFFKV